MNLSVFNLLKQIIAVFEPTDIIAYTDASLHPKNAGIGAVLFISSSYHEYIVEVSVSMPVSSSSLLELLATELVLDACPSNCRLTINSDCLSTVNLLMGASLPTKDGKIVKRILDNIHRSVNIRYAPRELKEMTIADELANEASISGKDRITYRGV